MSGLKGALVIINVLFLCKKLKIPVLKTPNCLILKMASYVLIYLNFIGRIGRCLVSLINPRAIKTS